MRTGSRLIALAAASMKSSGRLQMSAGDQTHILLNGADGFEKQAAKGSVYTQFDIAGDAAIRITNAKSGWGVVYGPSSLGGKAIQKTGTTVIIPKVANVKILKIK